MAYDAGVAQRVREQLVDIQGLSEKKMFGWSAFLVHGNMACGVLNDKLVVRMGKEKYDEVRNTSHTSDMNFTGRTMKSMIYVDPKGFEDDRDLEMWINLGVKYAQSLPAKR